MIIKLRFVEKADRCVVEMRLWPFWLYWFTAKDRSEAEKLVRIYNAGQAGRTVAQVIRCSCWNGGEVNGRIN